MSKTACSAMQHMHKHRRQTVPRLPHTHKTPVVLMMIENKTSSRVHGALCRQRSVMQHTQTGRQLILLPAFCTKTCSALEAGSISESWSMPEGLARMDAFACDLQGREFLRGSARCDRCTKRPRATALLRAARSLSWLASCQEQLQRAGSIGWRLTRHLDTMHSRPVWSCRVLIDDPLQ